MLRKLAIAASALLVVLVLAVGGGLLWVTQLDFRGLAERKGSEALGRPVTIGALEIGWGDPLRLEIRDLKIANAPGGSRPEMATVGEIDAWIDVAPLLHGTLRYRRLEVTRADILLERDKTGTGNWKFAGGGGGSPGGLAVMPKDRTQFPTLLDFALQDSRITYITSSGKPLVVALKRAAIRTADESQPVTVVADGAYNDLPVTVQATTDSFDVLRDADTPFEEDATLTNDNSTVALKGRVKKPLDFDGVDAALTVRTKNLGRLLQAVDAGLPADFPLQLSGVLQRQGDHWQFDGIRGAMAENAVTGALTLDEGPRGGSDKIAIKARYDTLVLDRMLGSTKDKDGKSGDWKSIALQLPDRASPEIKTDLAAGRLQYGGIALSDVALKGTVGPGALDLGSVRFAMAGATFEANGTAKADGKATHLHVDAGLPGAKIGSFLKLLGLATDQIAGQISARATLDATGTRLGEALARADGAAVFAMIDGKVARDVLEKASTDLRTLFRKGKGMSTVKCLLGVAAVKAGVARVSPLVLRTTEATLTGGGSVDLLKQRIDLTIRSDPKSTGFFALDLPIRISGPLDAPHAAPDSKSKFKPNLTLPDLPKPIRQVAEHSGCLEDEG